MVYLWEKHFAQINRGKGCPVLPTFLDRNVSSWIIEDNRR